MSENRVKVTTADGTALFKPLALSWLEPGKFTVSGTDDDGRIQRVLLRFESPEKARRVADELALEAPQLTTTPVPPALKVMHIEMKSLYSLGSLLSLAYRVLIFSAILGLGIYVAFTGGSLIVELELGLVGIYMLVMVALSLHLMRRQWKGVLRFGSHSFDLGATVSPFRPRKIDWRDDRTIVLGSRTRKVRLVFANSQQAVEAVGLIRGLFPDVNEAHDKSMGL